jgi:hypothetical protein
MGSFSFLSLNIMMRSSPVFFEKKICRFSSDLGGSWCIYQEKQSVGSLYSDFDLFFWFVLLQGMASPIL